MANCEEKLELLQQQNEKYKALLTQMLQDKKQIGIVISGPFVTEDMNWYRVQINGNNEVVSYKQDVLFGDNDKVIPLQSEVVVVNGAIAAIVPKKLKVEEKVPDFKLITWDAIGGLKSQIEQIREAVEMPMKHAALAKQLGLSPMKGVLLHGPAGCGKTLIAKAIASIVLKSQSAKPGSFVYVKGAEMLSMYIGAAEQRVKKMFDNARQYARENGMRAVIFLDEAEAILPVRGSKISSDIETTIVPTFLAEMDGFDDHSPFMILSSNLPNSIDSAVLREGRIDIKIPIGRPTKEDAHEIFDIHLRKVKCHDERKTLSLLGAELLYGSEMRINASGALIETIVKMSIQKAMARKVQDSTCPTGVIAFDIEESIHSLNHYK